MALTPGTRLGAYTVGSPLGVGGMGEVYRATDSNLGRDVAIKVLPEQQGVIGVGPIARATDADARLSDVMQRYWTNFAKTGDPNSAGAPNWPKFDAKSRGYVEFATTGPAIKQALRRPYCDLFIEHVQGVIGN